jgi:hypothetical protein
LAAFSNQRLGERGELKGEAETGRNSNEIISKRLIILNKNASQWKVQLK